MSCGFSPEEKRRHGASAQTAMTHIAIQEALNGRAVEWIEHMRDQQYEAHAGQNIHTDSRP